MTSPKYSTGTTSSNCSIRGSSSMSSSSRHWAEHSVFSLLSLCPIAQLRQQRCANSTPPSNSLQHNKLLQGGWGIFLLLHKTSFLQIIWFSRLKQRKRLFSPKFPSSNLTSWLLTKSEGSGSHRTQLSAESFELMFRC